MKAIGIAALVVALAGPAAAQQTQQGSQPAENPNAGAAQNTRQNERTAPNDAASEQNQNRQGDRGVGGAVGQNDRGAAGAAAQNNSELPATASPLAAIGMLGLLSFAGATFVRRRRTRDL